MTKEIVLLTLQHLYLVLFSLLFAFFIAIPLGIIMYKKKFHVELLLNIASLLQSFPALGLFAILITFLGVGPKTVIVALTLYAILPILQSVIVGFKSINPEYYEFIEILKLPKKVVFQKIEFPLILPAIINGTRLAFIYTVSTATIGTLVGGGGLGDLIYLGLQEYSLQLTILGIIPLLIITTIGNYIFNYLEKISYTEDYKVLKNGKKI